MHHHVYSFKEDTMKNRHLALILLVTALGGCKQEYTPKPRGYFRIAFPEKSYALFYESGFPYRFEKADYSEIEKPDGQETDPFDITISTPRFKADIHISYKQIPGNGGNRELAKLLEDSRTLAYKHTLKADAIEEKIFMNPSSKVFGTIYRIEGNAASPLQFYLTDSVRHFLRGSFYIRETPNIDSLRPVIHFMESDIIRLIETTAWN